jgi:hypothetical protein
MRDRNQRNRAYLAALRAELARELERFDIISPAADASAETWARFLDDAHAAARIERPELVRVICLIRDVLRGTAGFERVPPPPGSFVRDSKGKLVPLADYNADE